MTDRREMLRSLLGLPVVAAVGGAGGSPVVDIAATVATDESTLLVFRLTERVSQEAYERVNETINTTLKRFNITAPAILLPASIEFDYVRLSAKDRQDATKTD